MGCLCGPRRRRRPDNSLDITNHIGYMPQRRVRGGIRVSPLSRTYGRRLWTKATATREARTGLLKIWIPFGQVDRERARPTAASHARGRVVEFQRHLIRRSQSIDAKPSLSCQANQSAGFRPLAYSPGVMSALASGGWGVGAFTPHPSFASRWRGKLRYPSPRRGEVMEALNPRPFGERDTQAWQLAA
jgi:hypothetical protein